jgi:hypothetical protein
MPDDIQGLRKRRVLQRCGVRQRHFSSQEMSRYVFFCPKRADPDWYISFSQTSPSAVKQHRSDPLPEQSTLYEVPNVSMDPKETGNGFQKMDNYDSVSAPLLHVFCFGFTLSDSVPNPLILTTCSHLHCIQGHHRPARSRSQEPYPT